MHGAGPKMTKTWQLVLRVVTCIIIRLKGSASQCKGGLVPNMLALGLMLQQLSVVILQGLWIFQLCQLFFDPQKWHGVVPMFNKLIRD